MQCPKVLPCTLAGCNKPDPDAWCLEVITLYQDCRQRNALPETGGVLDQQADLMRWFRILDERIAKHRQEALEREKQEWPTSRQT